MHEYMINGHVVSESIFKIWEHLDSEQKIVFEKAQKLFESPTSAQVALERLKGMSQADKIEAEKGVPEFDSAGLRGEAGQLGDIGLPGPSELNSIEATLAQRGSRYGDFTDHAAICQDLKRVMLRTNAISGRGFDRLSDVQKQALEVIADKIARILSGDPNYDDNWHDIQGYAKLVEDRLPKVAESK